ncbi:helix-turn-helix domain-containing protein [Hyphococcus sp.]|uniref:helix-turn-helix domain-containing protein n=1 Tax=Hyphococcus sp. TaxID=2038636 RepID=UPI0035C72E63
MAKPQKAAETTSGEGGKRSGPHPIDVHVGSRVKLRRMILGMSQETLGKSLGLTFQQIQKYEKGVNRIGASRMYELSRLLEVPVQFFYDDYGDRPAAIGFAEGEPGERVMALVNSPEGVQLCRYFSEIKDPQVRKRVLDLVKSIAETEGVVPS